MSHSTPFNEARVLTELRGYNWKLSMMLKLSSLPMEQIKSDLQMMAKVVDLIPEEHPLTKKWTARLERLFEKALVHGSSDVPDWFMRQIGHQSTEECRAVSSVNLNSPNSHQLSTISNCRFKSPVAPKNLTIDFHFTLSYQQENFENEVTSSEMTFHLSFGPSPLEQNLGRIMAAPRRSYSTEAIRQVLLDTNNEVSEDTVYSKFRNAFEKLKPMDEKKDQKEAIRNLVVLLVKCRIILRSLKPKRKNLETAIFNWAYLKLNLRLAKAFKQQRPRKQFTCLISFLTSLLTNMTYLTKMYPLDMVCNYCKLPGHYVRSCPSTHSITCFNCFQMGHTRRLCKNKKVDPKYLLENL